MKEVMWLLLPLAPLVSLRLLLPSRCALAGASPPSLLCCVSWDSAAPAGEAGRGSEASRALALALAPSSVTHASCSGDTRSAKSSPTDPFCNACRIHQFCGLYTLSATPFQRDHVTDRQNVREGPVTALQADLEGFKCKVVCQVYEGQFKGCFRITMRCIHVQLV